MDASSSSSSSGSVGVGVISTPPPAATRMTTLGAGESCSFLAPDATRGCRAARSCQSCLLTAGCMVSTIGKCVSPQEVVYNPTIEYHRAIELGLVVTDGTQAHTDERVRATQTWQFPAGSARYCAASDEACSTCVRHNFWRSNTTFPDSRFCLGDDGACVCVDVCERRWYVQDDCATPVPAYYLTSDNIAERLLRGLLGMGLFVIIVLAVMLRKKRQSDSVTRAQAAERERQREARRERRHARSRQLGVDPLTLSGWESFRRDLIDKETARLASGGGADAATTSPRRGTLDVDDDGMASEPSGDGGAVHSPRGTEPVSTAYVSLEESGPPAPTAISTTSRRPIVARLTAARATLTAADNQATPSRQALAPIRSYRAST